MYKVITLGQIAYQGTDISAALEMFLSCVNDGMIAYLRHDGLLIASNDEEA